MLEPGMFESSLEAHEECAGKMKACCFFTLSVADDPLL